MSLKRKLVRQVPNTDHNLAEAEIVHNDFIKFGDVQDALQLFNHDNNCSVGSERNQ